MPDLLYEQTISIYAKTISLQHTLRRHRTKRQTPIKTARLLRDTNLLPYKDSAIESGVRSSSNELDFDVDEKVTGVLSEDPGRPSQSKTLTSMFEEEKFNGYDEPFENLENGEPIKSTRSPTDSAEYLKALLVMKSLLESRKTTAKPYFSKVKQNFKRVVQKINKTKTVVEPFFPGINWVMISASDRVEALIHEHCESEKEKKPTNELHAEFANRKVRVIDLIRMKKIDWTVILSLHHFSLPRFDGHFVLKCEANPELSNAVIVKEKGLGLKKKRSGIAVSNLIEKILVDKNFKHSIFLEMFPNQSIFSGLFGGICSDTEPYFEKKDNDVYPEDSTSNEILALPAYDEMINMASVCKISSGHPLLREDSEIADLLELDQLLEKSRLRRRSVKKAKVVLRENAKPVKSNLEEQLIEPFLGHRQILQLQQVLKEENIVQLGRQRTQSTPMKSRKDFKNHHRLNSIPFIDLESIDGIMGNEMPLSL